METKEQDIHEPYQSLSPSQSLYPHKETKRKGKEISLVTDCKDVPPLFPGNRVCKDCPPSLPGNMASYPGPVLLFPEARKVRQSTSRNSLTHVAIFVPDTRVDHPIPLSAIMKEKKCRRK